MLIAVTRPEPERCEIDRVRAVLDAGLPLLHLRLPGCTRDAYRTRLEALDADQRARVLVQDYPDLVDDYGLYGVHLPLKSLPDVLPAGTVTS